MSIITSAHEDSGIGIVGPRRPRIEERRPEREDAILHLFLSLSLARARTSPQGNCAR